LVVSDDALISRQERLWKVRVFIEPKTEKQNETNDNDDSRNGKKERNGESERQIEEQTDGKEDGTEYANKTVR